MTSSERYRQYDRRARRLAGVMFGVATLTALGPLLPWEWGRPWAMLGCLALQFALFGVLRVTLRKRAAASEEMQQ